LKTYRVAVIGLGRMGSTLDMSVASAAAESERLELVAGSDLLPERRDAFKDTWGVGAVYENYMEMVKKESPDLVAICTTATGLQKPGREAPSKDFVGDSHADDALPVIEAGVPMLFVEKAMSCSIAKADAVLEACRRHGTKYGSGLMRRHGPRYRVARKAIEDGEIGEVATAVHYGGSSLMHGHIHSIDTLSYLLGDPKISAVRGELVPRDMVIEGNRIESDPRATYQLLFENGVEASTVPGGQFEFEIVGTEGSVRLMNNGSSALLRKAVPNAQGRAEWLDAPLADVPQANNTVICLEDLVDAHEQGRPAHGDIEVTHHVTEACIGVAESHRQGGKWIELPVGNRDMYIFHV
jgi:predicted dehydrogenase